MNAIRKKANAAPGVPALDPKTLEAIGLALKAYHADLVQAPLPDKLVELLARLKVGDSASEPRGSGDANR